MAEGKNDNFTPPITQNQLKDQFLKSISTPVYHPSTIWEADVIGQKNTELRPEDPIYDLVRGTAPDREQYPPLPQDLGEIPSPKSYLRDHLSGAPDTSGTNPALKGSNTPKSTSKDHAKKLCLALLSNRGNDSQFSKKNQCEILLNFALDGSNNCTAPWLSRRTSSGQSSKDIGHCPQCGRPWRFRGTCDSPKCTQPKCSEKYGTEKGEAVADKIKFILDHAPGINVQQYHVFISPPPELAPFWAQWSQYLEELYNIASKILKKGLGASAYSIVAHTHRGAKKDRDLSEASRWLGIDPPEDPEGTEARPFWRVGFHFHSLALIFNPRTPQYLKSLCKEIYNLTGFIVKIKPVKDHPENIIQYQLSHAGIFTKASSKRSIPAIRFYGNFAPTKIKKVDLGVIIQGRKCPADGSPLNVYAKHGVPNTVHRKLYGYLPVWPRGVVNPSAEEIKEIIEDIPPTPYWSPNGKRISQKILTKRDFQKLKNVPDLHIPARLINNPDLLYNTDPYEPDEYDDGDLPPGKLSWDPEGAPSQDPPEIIPPRPQPSALGLMYDLTELMEFCPGSRFIQPIPS